MTRFIPLSIALALCACASELHTSSSLDAQVEKTDVAHAEEHAQAQDHVEDRSATRTAENVVTTTTGGAVELDVVTTKPDGTKTERHYRKAPVETKVDARKHDNVQKAITDDAKSMFDGSADTASKTVEKVKTKAETAKKAKPSLGFLVGLWPFIATGGLVVFLVVTGTNPVAIATKILAWILAKVRKQASAE